jgi:hypothetical protein
MTVMLYANLDMGPQRRRRYDNRSQADGDAFAGSAQARVAAADEHAANPERGVAVANAQPEGWRRRAQKGGAAFGRADAAGGQLLERLLLVLYAYGMNTGIRAVAAGEHSHREKELHYERRRYLSPELVIGIANATFGALQQSTHLGLAGRVVSARRRRG